MMKKQHEIDITPRHRSSSAGNAQVWKLSWDGSITYHPSKQTAEEHAKRLTEVCDWLNEETN